MRSIRFDRLLLAFLLLSLANGVLAQDGERMIEQYLFPPEAIADHQHEIGLTDDQFRQLQEYVANVTAKSLEVKRGLAQRMEEFEGLLAAEQVDVEAAVASARRLLAVEQDMKLLHLTTMLSIKNILTPEQQQKLRQIMEERRRTMR